MATLSDQAIVLAVGTFGALIAQYFDMQNVQEVEGKRQNLEKKMEYLALVIKNKQEEKKRLSARMMELENKVIELPRGVDETQAKNFLAQTTREISRIEKDTINLDRTRNELLEKTSVLLRGFYKKPAAMYVIAVIVGGFFAWFLYYLDSVQGTEVISARVLITSLFAGSFWPLLYNRFVGAKPEPQIDAIADKYRQVFDMVEQNLTKAQSE